MGRGGIRVPAVPGGRLLAACASVLILATCATGCVGYVMGWADAEVDRLRRIVAELEAKNAALVEEVIELSFDRLNDPEALDGRTGDGTTDGQQPPMNADLKGQAVPGERR